MVYEIYSRTGNMDFAKTSLPALLKEHHFWNSGFHSVSILDAEGCNCSLSRYYAMWNKPRPESSTIDMETASVLSNASEKQHLYRELATGAETGWDFSSRWMRNASGLMTLATTSIIPVDINAYILQDDYTWDASNQNRNIFASNFIPLSIESFNSDLKLVEKVRQSLQRSGLVCAAGIATSLTNSGQQWDFPNGWAPLQHLIVEGLVCSGSKEATSMAEDIAVRWIRTNYVAYKKMNAMVEKYDVEKCGELRRGGEYVTQTGFGWSNGVVLAFLEEFGWPKDLKIDCYMTFYSEDWILTDVCVTQTDILTSASSAAARTGAFL
ncbi:hypothetical protein RHSIM_Rhsim02G0248900 [Rhododendron simsii]|uniref:Trehalase n=1 Tax=Rhododendron simsii TaxID=118357 RepID=A0A834LVT5_RHOSS|nr:hypothetical protein RHSIM_Rhsim02G0248900 [Rhododendron simsii]